MKKLFLFSICCVLLSSCAPVLSKNYLHEGSREVSFQALRQNPDAYKGRLYVFGGVIIDTKLSQEGSRIEAMHVPVDRYGHFEERGQSQGRFFAVLPQDQGLLDPEVFTRGRRISLAAEFLELRKAQIDEMEYVYPVFRILQYYLWPLESVYPGYYYDPWFYPWPYYYWDPWWRYPYYYNYYNYYRYPSRPGPPVYRRSPPPNQPPPAQSPQMEQHRGRP